MSLINQMLKDLEQRRVTSDSVKPISGEVRAVSAVKEFRPTPILTLLVGLLMAACATWLFVSYGKPLPALAKIAPIATIATLDPIAVMPLPQSIQPVPAVDATVTTALPASLPVPVTATITVQAKPTPITPLPRAIGMDLRLSASLQNSDYLIATRTAKAKPAILGQSLPNESKPSESKPSKSKSSESKLNQNKPQIPDTPAVALPAQDTQAQAVPIAPIAQASDVLSKTKALPKPTSITLVAPSKTTSATQQSDNLYRQSVTLLQQGQVTEAQDLLRKSLWENALNFKARQALVALLVDNKHTKEANQWLKEGLKLSPEQSGFSMALARLQLESGDSKSARGTLQAGLSYAGDEADYHAFYAALLQRDEQHEVAIQHYLIALRTNAAMPTWLVGVAISLQAQGKFNDATTAFQRARETGQLTPQLLQFVESRLKQIKPALNAQ